MNGIQSLNAGAPDLRLTGDQRPQEDSIRMRIKQIAEQSGHAESFPATDSDFAALAQLSDSPDDFPSTDYDFEVILRIAKESEIIKVTAATANRLHVILSALEIKPREVT